MSTTARVLVGLTCGAALGIGLSALSPEFAATLAGIVQPVGRLWLNALQMTVVSLFRMTSPVQYIGVSAYIAWIYGIDLSVPQLAAGAALAVVISLGSVGLPGQVSFMATNMPVAQAMGLPIDPMGLMIAVETVPDAFATLGNVTGDLTATTVVAGARQVREESGGFEPVDRDVSAHREVGHETGAHGFGTGDTSLEP